MTSGDGVLRQDTVEKVKLLALKSRELEIWQLRGVLDVILQTCEQHQNSEKIFSESQVKYERE